MTLLLLLARATALVCLALLAARLLRGRSAELRADLWRATFVALAVLPLATASLPGLRWRPPIEATTLAVPAQAASAPAVDLAGAADESSIPATSEAERLAGATPATELEASGPAGSIAPRLAWTLVGLWIAGAALGLLRVVRGLSRARAIVRGARVESEAPVRVASSPRVEGGFVWDPRPFGAPTIVVAREPRGGEEWRRAVLAHELHHVERGDGPFLAFASVVAALLWPTPFVWIALRRLRLESERAADDAVLREGVRATDYAHGLVALAAGPDALPAPGMAAGHLPRRVEALLDVDVTRATPSRVARTAVAAAAVVAFLPVAALSAERQEAPARVSDGPHALAVAALLWLHDADAGAWCGDVGFKLNYKWRVTAADVPHVGVTGLAVEALFASGHRSGEGPAGRAIDAGLDFLIAHQDEAGYISAHGTRMRSHAYAMRGLAAAVAARSDREDVHDALAAALTFTIEAQSVATGGWRFTPSSRDTDILETAYQMDAMLAAHQLWVVDGARWSKLSTACNESKRSTFRYVSSLRVSDPGGASDGAFRYQETSASRITPNTIAAGILVMGTEVYDDPERWSANLAQMRRLRARRAASLDDADGHFLTWDAELLVERIFDQHVRIGAPMVVEPASAWRAERRRWLLDHQLTDGGWRCTTGPGDAYTTAIGCLLLAPNQ
ncbi:MAG: M56 family metallopeptidase [Planctomycetota bacterium]